MSQLPLEERLVGQLSDTKLASLLKRSLNQDFRGQNNEELDYSSHTKSHVPKRKGPYYRKIRRYFKSISQYKKERDRRKQILQMFFVEYRSQQYMANKLGVSVSTVKRDLRKLQGYIKRQNNRVMRQFQEEQRQRLERRMEGLSLRERFDVLSEELERIHTLRKGANYRGHYTIIHLDMTQLDPYGIPKLTFLPRQTLNKNWAFPHKIDVRIKMMHEDKLFEASLGTIALRETRSW